MKKDLSQANYIGRVVYINDPDFSGRCKVRVFGLLDGTDENGNYSIPDEMLPWFTPIASNSFSGGGDTVGAGSLSVPKVGALVRVRFANNDIVSGEYTAIQNVDPQLIEDIKDDYVGTHVVCYDSEKNLAILYQVNSGLRIYYQGSYIQISPDSMITIAHDSLSSIIQLKDDIITVASNNNVTITAADSVTINSDNVELNGAAVSVGAGANQPAVLGNELVKVLRLFASEISLKYPQTPANPDAFTINSILSNNVTVS